MHHLITLGAADLLGADDCRIGPVVQQRKRFLLLAYIATGSRGAPVRRDVVLPLFWPESDGHYSRKSLRQSIYYLRRSFEPDVALIEAHETLAVDPDVLSCDALEMEAAVAAGDYRRALDLYAGEFLPGMFVEGSLEFDAWLEERRRRYRELAVQAARGLAGAERERGNMASAAHWGRRLAELAGVSEPLLLESMELLVGCGDRAGAAEAYAGFERRLEAELEARPSKDTRRMARRLLDGAGGTGQEGGADQPDPGPADEARLATYGGPAPPPVDPDVVAGPPTANGGADRKRRFGTARFRARDLATLPVILVLAMLASWHGLASGPPLEGTDIGSPLASITIREFDHYGSEPIAAMVAQALPTIARRELSGVRGLVVLSPDMPAPAAAATASRRSTERLASDAFDVRGSVRVAADGIRVDLALWQTASGRLVQAVSLDHPDADLEAAAESLGRRIASAVRQEIGRELRARETRARTLDRKAWEAVQLAEALVREAGDLRRRGMVAAAVAGLAEADSMLALAEKPATWVGPAVLRARVAAEKAWLAFMPPVADASVALAHFENALSHATRALAISRDDPAAREARGTIAFWMSQTLDLDEGRARQLYNSAEIDLNAAIRSDPSRTRAWLVLGQMAHARADFTAAYWTTKRAHELDTFGEHSQELLVRLFDTAYELGDDAGAARWCGELRQLFHASPTATYCTLAEKAWGGRRTADDVAGAWATVRALNALRSGPVVTPRLEMMVASILASAGLPDSAEAVIGRVRESGRGDPELLQLEAHARLLLGQPDSAAALLASYVDGDPGRRAYVLKSRRFGTSAARPIP